MKPNTLTATLLAVLLAVVSGAVFAEYEWAWDAGTMEEDGTTSIDGNTVESNPTGGTSPTTSSSSQPAVVVQAVAPTSDCQGPGKALQWDASSKSYVCYDHTWPDCDSQTQYLHTNPSTGQYECASSANLSTIPNCGSSTEILQFDGSSWSCRSHDNLKELPNCDSQTQYLQTDGSDWMCASSDNLKTIAECDNADQILRFTGTDWTCGDGDPRWVNRAGDSMSGNLDFNNNWITDLRGLKVYKIYAEGGGSWVHFKDHIDMDNHVIRDVYDIRVDDLWPNSRDTLASRYYVDQKVSSAGGANGVCIECCKYTYGTPSDCVSSCGSGTSWSGFVMTGWRKGTHTSGYWYPNKACRVRLK